MNISELQKKEALKRMRKLELLPEVIHDFDKKSILFYSEHLNRMLNAVLYWVSNNQELEDKVKDFENKTGALVYHVQLSHTEFGDMYSFMYVSSEPDEWNLDEEDLENHQCYVYVWNGDIEEFGSIGIESSMGGITRTW